MRLYEAIYYRKSVRSYKMDRMPDEFFGHLDKFLENLNPLYKDIRCHIDVVCAFDRDVTLKGIFKVKAPYYIVIRSEEGYEAFENAGYIMEQISLYLTTKEIGSCYQGSLKVDYKTDFPELKQCAVLAFGYSDAVVLRDSSKAPRKNIAQMCIMKEDIDENVMGLLEAARLAPSALNRQPWRFVAYHNRLHVFETERISEKSNAKAHAIDMGIVQCHLILASEERWIKSELKKLDHISVKEVKNHRYVKSLIIS